MDEETATSAVDAIHIIVTKTYSAAGFPPKRSHLVQIEVHNTNDNNNSTATRVLICEDTVSREELSDAGPRQEVLYFDHVPRGFALACSATRNEETDGTLFSFTPISGEVRVLSVMADDIGVVVSIEPEVSTVEDLSITAKTIEVRGQVNLRGARESVTCVCQHLSLFAEDVSLSGLISAEAIQCDATGAVRLSRANVLAQKTTFKCKNLSIAFSRICADIATVQATTLLIADSKLAIGNLFSSLTVASCSIRTSELLCEGEVCMLNGLDHEWNRLHAPAVGEESRADDTDTELSLRELSITDSTICAVTELHVASQYMTLSARTSASADDVTITTVLVSNIVILEIGCSRFGSSPDGRDPQQDPSITSWPQPWLSIPTAGVQVVGHLALFLSGHGVAFNQGELSSGGILHCALRGSLCNLGAIMADGEVEVEVQDKYTASGGGMIASNGASVILKACTVSLAQEASVSAGEELSVSCRDLHLHSRGAQLVAKGDVAVRCLHMKNHGRVHSGHQAVLTIGHHANKHVITLKESANLLVVPNVYLKELAARTAPAPPPAAEPKDAGAAEEKAAADSAKDETRNNENDTKNKTEGDDKGKDNKAAEDEEVGYPDEGELVNLGGVIVGVAGVTITASSRVSNACSAEGYAAAVQAAIPSVGAVESKEEDDEDSQESEREAEGVICSPQGFVQLAAGGDIHNDYAGSISAHTSLSLHSQGRNILNFRHGSITCAGAGGKTVVAAGSFMQSQKSTLRVLGSLLVTLQWCLHNKQGSEIRFEQADLPQALGAQLPAPREKQEVVLQMEQFVQTSSHLVSGTDIHFRPAARCSVFAQNEGSQVLVLQGGVHFQTCAAKEGPTDQQAGENVFVLVSNTHSQIGVQTSVRFDGESMLRNTSGVIHAGGAQVIPSSLRVDSDAASAVTSDTAVRIYEYLGRLQGGAGCGIFRAPRIILDIRGSTVVDLSHIVYADLFAAIVELCAQGSVVQNKRRLRIPRALAILCHRFANSSILEIDGSSCTISASVIVNHPEPVRNHFSFGYNKERSMEHDINVGDYFASRKELVFEELLVNDTDLPVGAAEIHCRGSLTLHAASAGQALLPAVQLTNRAGNLSFLPGGIYTAMGGISAGGDITVQAGYLINGVPTHELQHIDLSHVDARLTAFKLGFYGGNVSFISAGGVLTMRGNEGRKGKPISLLNFLAVIEAGRGFKMEHAELLLNYGGQIRVGADVTDASIDAKDTDTVPAAAAAPAPQCESSVIVNHFFNVSGARRDEDQTRGTFIDYTITATACFHTTGSLTVYSADFRNIGSYVLASGGMKISGTTTVGAADVFEGTLLNDALALLVSQRVWLCKTTVTNNSRNCCGVRYGSKGTVSHQWSEQTINAAHRIIGAAIVSDVALTLKYQHVLSCGLLFAPVLSISAVRVNIGMPACDPRLDDPRFQDAFSAFPQQAATTVNAFPSPLPMTIAGVVVTPLDPFNVRSSAGIGHQFASSREWWAEFLNKHSACFGGDASAGWARAVGAGVSVRSGDVIIGEGGVIESLDGVAHSAAEEAGTVLPEDERVFTRIFAAGNMHIDSGVIHSDGTTAMRINGSLFARTLVQRLALARGGNWSAESGGWYERAKQIARISGAKGLEYEIVTGDEVLQGVERFGGSGGIRSVVLEGNRVHLTVPLSSHLHYVNREKEDVREERTVNATTNVLSRSITTGAIVDITPKGSDVRASEYVEAASYECVAAEIKRVPAYNTFESSYQLDENDGWNKDNFAHQAGTQLPIATVYNIAGEGTVKMTALDGNIVLCGVHINAIKTVLTALNGDVQLTIPEIHTFSQTFESTTSQLWQGVEMDKRHDQTYLLNYFAGTVEVEARTLLVQSVSGHLCKVLPMIVLKGDTVLLQQYLDEIHEHEHFEQDGPTAVLAIIVAIAVSIATYGAATSIVGPALAGAINLSGCAMAEGMLAAGFCSLCSQAAVSLLKNKMDPLGAAKDLASTDTLKNVAVAMMTACLTSSLEFVTGYSTNPSEVTGFTEHLMNQTNRTLAGMGAGLIIGENPDLGRALVTTVVATGAALAANELGAARVEGITNDAVHFGGHTAVGFVAGVAANKGSFQHGIAGGAGAFTAEVIAEVQIPTYKGAKGGGACNPAEKRFAHNVAKLTVAIGAGLAGANASTLNAAMTGATNALDYNHSTSVNKFLTIGGKPLQVHDDGDEQGAGEEKKNEPAPQREEDPFLDDAVLIAKLEDLVQQCQARVDAAQGAVEKLFATWDLMAASQAHAEVSDEAACRRGSRETVRGVKLAAKYTAEHPYKVVGGLCVVAGAIVIMPAITLGTAVTAGALGAAYGGLSWYDDHISSAAPADLGDLDYDQKMSLAANLVGGAAEPFLTALRPLRMAAGAVGLYGAYNAADSLGAPTAVTDQLKELTMVAGGGAVVGGGLVAKQWWAARGVMREAAGAASHVKLGGVPVDDILMNRSGAELFPLPSNAGIGHFGQVAEDNFAALMASNKRITTHRTQANNNTGFDTIISSDCPVTGKRTFAAVEVKATSLLKGGARLNMTRHGRQMETRWTGRKLELLAPHDPVLVSEIMHSLKNGDKLGAWLYVERPQGRFLTELPALDSKQIVSYVESKVNLPALLEQHALKAKAVIQ